MKEVEETVKPATKAEPVKAPEPIKPSEPVETKAEPKPEPAPTAMRNPPPSMKEQGGSMMAMADKFSDQDAAKDDSDDASSFEEVQRPAERTSAVRPASSNVTRDEAIAPVSELWKEPAKAEKGPGASTLDQADKVVLPPSKQASSTLDSATPTTPAVGPGSGNTEALEREIKNLKTVMAQQSRQISNMALTMDILKSEIMTLKEKNAD